ncbi:hypothetical protein, partial [Enterococcus faecalis]|uniref:hypothetical protein n=1 Tax=Enterococcus faecalis TaxID=1351 RepID=UPI0022F0666E
SKSNILFYRGKMKFCVDKSFRPEEFAADSHMQQPTSHISRSPFVEGKRSHVEDKRGPGSGQDCAVARKDFNFV